MPVVAPALFYKRKKNAGKICRHSYPIAVLVQLEVDWHCVRHLHRFSTLQARFEFWQALYNTDGLFVKYRVNTTCYLHIVDLAFLINNKLHENLSCNRCPILNQNTELNSLLFKGDCIFILLPLSM